MHGQTLIEDKAQLIHGLKDQIKKSSEQNNKAVELKEMGKREAEIEYKEIVNDRQDDHRKAIKNYKA